MDNLDILKNEALKERNNNINKIKYFLNNLLLNVCGKNALEVGIRLNTTYIVSAKPEEISLESFILDRDNKEIFGSSLDIRYGSKWKREDKAKQLQLNQGSMGLISRQENLGKYYADILKGQIWLNEDKLVNLFNSLDWSKYYEYTEAKTKLDLNQI